MKKKLMAGLLIFTMMATAALPAMAAPKAKKIAIKGKKTVAVGSTIELDSVITPKKAKVRDRNIIWESSKPSVARVLDKRDDDTKIEGRKAGTATITVRIRGTSIKAKCKITVKKNNNKAEINKAKKTIDTYKKDAKKLRAEIKKLKLSKTYRTRRAQYRKYENKIEKIDDKLDRLEDKWEDKYEAGKISYSQYESLENRIEGVEEYLEELEDYLEEKFDYEFD
ncbi:MAG: hypothetical protein HFH03_05415 [Dorea sp.]|jgi:type 1 fimbria pilin|nr:hypothetical protein [Dorea sp.]